MRPAGTRPWLSPGPSYPMRSELGNYVSADTQVLARIERARLARDEAEAELAALIDHTGRVGAQ